MRVEMATEADFPTTPRPMRVEMATDGDFPTTPRPMRVETASDGDILTPDKKDIKERQAGEVGRLGGRGSWCWLVRLVLGHRRL